MFEQGAEGFVDDADPTAAALRLVRLDFGADLVPSRVEAEEEAVALLEGRAGSMTREEALQLGRLLNRHSKQGALRQDRFSPAFHGNAMYRLVDDLEAFNGVVADVWTATEDQALDTVGRMFGDRSALHGAGTSFPSALMYLRDRGRWAVLIKPTLGGLGVLTGQSPPMPRDRRAYEDFSQALTSWREQHGIAPQEADVVLTEVWRLHKPPKVPPPSTSRTASRGVATTTAADGKMPVDLQPAMDFLADLAQHNSSEWMNEHRDRYVSELREPFAALMESIAARHVRTLDPQLQTEVQANKVLATIRRRFPTEDGPYYSHYWGAFSRARKQGDVQLAILVDPGTLYANFSLGSAQPEHFASLRSALAARPDALLDQLRPYADRLTWVQRSETISTFEGRGGQEVDVPVLDGPALVRWLDDDGTSIQWRIHHGDPLLSDPRLIDELGDLLVAFHPLAAAAWGDDVEPAPVTVPISTPLDADDPDADVQIGPALSLADVADACHLPVEVLEGWVSDLARKPQAYFYGPPGTGKTHIASLLARHLATSEEHVHRVQFHPSYSYEDFVEGLRPEPSPEGHLTYVVRPGIFQNVCTRARRAPGERFVVVLDEMNRADLASVFGELLQLLEYRGAVVELPYSQKRFSVPPNIVVLATMNTADRSLAALDFALRRRFLAFQLSPSADVLRGWLQQRPTIDAALVLELFSAVSEAVGSDSPMAPGHSYWMADDLGVENAQRVWDHEVRPYLQEHWFDQPEHLDRLDQAVRGILAEHL